MFATLGFAALQRIPADMVPTFHALHRWLGSWRGIGDVVAGMNRQGYDLELIQYPDAWRCTLITRRAGALPHVSNRLGLGEDGRARRPAGGGTRARQGGGRRMIEWPSQDEVGV